MKSLGKILPVVREYAASSHSVANTQGLPSVGAAKTSQILTWVLKAIYGSRSYNGAMRILKRITHLSTLLDRLRDRFDLEYRAEALP